MKLRFRKNSLRLRVNQQEARSLASGVALQEQVHFPGNATLSYVLEPLAGAATNASFDHGIIKIGAPQEQLRRWADDDSIGIYLDFAAGGATLTVAIEKDLECVDGPEEERDPFAYPRSTTTLC